MKVRSFLLGILVVSLCTCTAGPPGGGYNFIDQNLQGEIGGVPWTFVSGTAEDPFGDDELWIKLYNIDPAGGDPWAGGAYAAAEDTLMVKLPETVGLVELSWGGQWFTLYDESTGVNIFCVEGAIEILTIDPVGLTVTGRVDARSDEGNYVNGNFSASYAP